MFWFKIFLFSSFFLLQITKPTNDDNYVKNFTLYFYSTVQFAVYNITKEIYIFMLINLECNI